MFLALRLQGFITDLYYRRSVGFIGPGFIDIIACISVACTTFIMLRCRVSHLMFVDISKQIACNFLLYVGAEKYFSQCLY